MVEVGACVFHTAPTNGCPVSCFPVRNLCSNCRICPIIAVQNDYCDTIAKSTITNAILLLLQVPIAILLR